MLIIKISDRLFLIIFRTTVNHLRANLKLKYPSTRCIIAEVLVNDISCPFSTSSTYSYPCNPIHFFYTIFHIKHAALIMVKIILWTKIIWKIIPPWISSLLVYSRFKAYIPMLNLLFLSSYTTILENCFVNELILYLK